MTVRNWVSQISYVVQDQPNGLAEALILGEKFLDGDSCALILGDNLFYGPGLGTHLQQNTSVEGALIFAYQVSEPSHYGVVEFDDAGTGDLNRREAGRAQEHVRGPGHLLL